MTNTSLDPRWSMVAYAPIIGDILPGRLLNFHRRWTRNVGDLTSSPLSYVQLAEDQRILELSGQLKEDDRRRPAWDKELEEIGEASGVIIGGGGLMEFDKHWPAVEMIGRGARKAIIWGAGSNSTGRATKQPFFEKDYSDFALIGCRDFGYESLGFQWVPCASCLHPIFDRTFEITRDVVYFGNVPAHGSIDDLLVRGIESDDMMGNANTTIEEVVEHLASAALVVSSSYHGCYWATLLGREVIAVGRNGGYPRSSKFYAFRHPVVVADSRNWMHKRSEAKSCPNALQECRKANLDFAMQVKELLAD